MRRHDLFQNWVPEKHIESIMEDVFCLIFQSNQF
jgi:hypothetical protein